MAVLVIGITEVLLPHGMKLSIMIIWDHFQRSVHQVSLNYQVPVHKPGRTAVARSSKWAKQIRNVDLLVIECTYESICLARQIIVSVFTKLDCTINKHWCRFVQGAVLEHIMAMIADEVNQINPPRPHGSWDNLPQMFVRIGLIVVHCALKSHTIGLL